MIKRDLAKLEASLGVSFRNQTLLAEALVHRSYLNEHRDFDLPHNERLEFLGDAVLELVVTDYLYRTYPEANEGDLTAYRAALVNANIVGEIGAMLAVNDYLLLSRGEARDTGRARAMILANAVEALIGAIYLDQGYEAAAHFISQNFFSRVSQIVAGNLWQDAKSRFQEKAQEVLSVTPSYRVLNETGPDHDKIFTVGLFLGEEQVTQGAGHSKQDAEQAAAELGLRERGWL